MRRAIAYAAAVVAFAAPAGVAAGASSPAAVPTNVTKTCSAGYVHARLSWGEKCLRAGEFCKIGNREYLRYGFYCPATAHLRRR